MKKAKTCLQIFLLFFLILVAAGPEVLWVIGMRMNESCKVTEETEEILEITVTVNGVNDEREDQHIDI